MMLCEFAVAFLFFLMAYSLTVANTTNITSAVEGGTNREIVVCNQYIGQDATAHEAIKKLDEKVDKLIKLLQPTPNPGKMSFRC